MVEFVSRYEKFDGLEYSPIIGGHGAIYGTTSCGKSYLVKEMCLNGCFSHCATIVFLGGKSYVNDENFIKTMKNNWNTLVYCYEIRTEEQLSAKINEIEKTLLDHRKAEYKRLGVEPSDDIDMRPNMAFANVKIVIDDLHKQVVKSMKISSKFAFIRHSGCELLFVTQSFKNVNMHDLVKENLMWVILFKLTQNKITLNTFLSDLSLHTSRSRSKNITYRSSLECIYNKLVIMNDSVPGFKSDDTSYLYIEMPKRAAKNVSHVRTAVANPNMQICFKEEGCSEVKILFAKRKEELTFRNRMNATMRVMTEREQRKKVKDFDFDNMNKEVENKNNSSDSSEDNNGEEDNKKDPREENKIKESLSNGFKEQKIKLSLPNWNQKTIRGQKRPRDNETSNSDSTDIYSEEGEMFKSRSPPEKKRKRFDKNKDRRGVDHHYSSNSRRTSSNKKINKNELSDRIVDGKFVSHRKSDKHANAANRDNGRRTKNIVSTRSANNSSNANNNNIKNIKRIHLRGNVKKKQHRQHQRKKAAQTPTDDEYSN